MDITFSRKVKDLSVSTAAVLTFPAMKLVYIRSKVDFIALEYIPSFLAFREAPTMIDLFKETSKDFANAKAEIAAILIDGNGELHPRECGLACHFGVLIDKPTIGCAKTIFSLDGLNRKTINVLKKEFKQMGQVKGYSKELVGKSGRVWGIALKATKKSFDPLIVTRGHKVSLESAVQIVNECCIHRVPEPVRSADKESRHLVNLFERKWLADVEKGNVSMEDQIKKFQKELDEKFLYNKL